MQNVICTYNRLMTDTQCHILNHLSNNMFFSFCNKFYFLLLQFPLVSIMQCHQNVSNSLRIQGVCLKGTKTLHREWRKWKTEKIRLRKMMWKSRKNYPRISKHNWFQCFSMRCFVSGEALIIKEPLKKLLTSLLIPNFTLALPLVVICHFIVLDGIYKHQQTMHNVLHSRVRWNSFLIRFVTVIS